MQRLFERQASIAKAIGHPVRVAVIDFLKDGEQCVCDIAAKVGSERTNLSKHLSVMVSAGVLESRKDGLKVMYRLKTPCVVKFLGCLRECLKAQVKETQELMKMI
ncbi:MAG: metalloregulator ArsR/SmtB family transcription factor [Planctomycetaceae bacterium]|nr:metalloregulator ArsR/SmtB family transcription factor [Planctomycetaceae bacterium]